MYHIVCISENTTCRETGGIDSYDERSLHLMTQMWPLYFSLHFKWCGFSHLHLFKIPEPWKQRNRLQRRKLPTSCTIPTTAGKIVFSSIYCFQIIFSFFSSTAVLTSWNSVLSVYSELFEAVLKTGVPTFSPWQHRTDIHPFSLKNLYLYQPNLTNMWN